MKQPPTYDAVHPIWIRGREWGIAEERQRIMPIARAAHPAIHNESPRPLCPVCVMITRIDPEL